MSPALRIPSGASFEAEAPAIDGFAGLTYMKVGILAGEPSGDNLGAGLMGALQRQLDGAVEFVGVGGPRMQRLGLRTLYDFERLSIHGFREPLVRLPELLRLLGRLVRRMREERVDVFVGVDFNVFNLLLEARLKKAGLPTAHYVSPSVYAWRRGRVRRLARSADVVLCLYPFEPAFYADVAVRAVFVGHPLADAIAPSAGNDTARNHARAKLGLSARDVVLAVLPGSRNSEVKLMLDEFLRAAQSFQRQHEGTRIVVPCVRTAIRTQVEAAAARTGIHVVCYDGDATLALTACNVALIKSGTSTLEALLLRRPMVVSYRLGPATYAIARVFVKTPYVALPNILAARALVPELLQGAATAANLAAQLHRVHAHPEPQLTAFDALHGKLRQGADENAARAVIGLARS